MFVVFQIGRSREWKVSSPMTQDSAFVFLTELQTYNPDTKFEIRQMVD